MGLSDLFRDLINIQLLPEYEKIFFGDGDYYREIFEILIITD